MVSGAAWLLDFVAFWDLDASLHLILLIKMVSNIAIRWTEVAVLIEPLQVFVFLSLFFAHVMRPSGSELGQTVCHPRSHHPEVVPLAGSAVALAEIAAGAALHCHHQQAYHPATA